MRIAAVLVALVSVLCACSGSGEPRPTSSASSSAASSSASPSPTAPRTGPFTTGPNVRPGEKPPEFPDAAKHHDVTGALLFAQYFMRALDWSIATNDSFLLRSVSSESCVPCQRLITQIDGLRSSGGKTEGGRIRIRRASVVSGHFRVKSEYVVEIWIDEEAVVLDQPSQARSTSAKARTNDASLIFVSYANGAWSVLEFGAPS